MEFFHYIDQLRHWILGLLIPIVVGIWKWISNKNKQIIKLEGKIEDFEKEVAGKIDTNYQDLDTKIQENARESEYRHESLKRHLEYRDEQDAKRDRQADKMMTLLEKMDDKLDAVHLQTERNTEKLRK